MTDWDRRFLDLAYSIASWSQDPSTQCGAVLVSPDRYGVVFGYNGFPRGITDDGRLDDRETKYKLILHSELNAILNAKRDLAGYTLYNVPLLPCSRCAVTVVQAGIVRVVAPKMTADVATRWGEDLTWSRNIFDEARVRWSEV